MAGRYETLFVVLARQATYAGEIDSSESMPGLHKRLQIRVLGNRWFLVRYSRNASNSRVKAIVGKPTISGTPATVRTS
jgi:hypothetical protein